MRFQGSVSPKAQPSQRHWLQCYGIGLAAVFVGWLARDELTALIGPTALPFIFFFPAVAVAAWYGGFGPASLSALIAVLAANRSFLDSRQWVPRTVYDIVASVSFLLA